MYRVGITGNSLRFTAAHLLCSKTGRLPMHGHDYKVSVMLEGDRNDDGYLFDFDKLRSTMEDICGTLNVRFIYPYCSEAVRLTDRSENYSMMCADGSYYSMPRNDFVFINARHASAECLGECIMYELVARVGIPHLVARGVRSVEVSITEEIDQVARFTRGIRDISEHVSPYDWYISSQLPCAPLDNRCNPVMIDDDELESTGSVATI